MPIRACVVLRSAVVLLSTGHSAGQMAIDWVTVGNPGNAADPLTGFGSVPYSYRIGATEVTNEQYAAFLNAVAASDPNELYNTSMGSNPRGGITRSGTNGSYTYSVRPNMGNKPVNFVSWYDAARFCNWLTNGQGSGGTESGAYTLDGATSISGITRDLSSPDQVFLPTEDEWYKAAYHQPASQGGDADDYWLYATQSNNVPTIATATATGDVANPSIDTVNYGFGADWNGVDDNTTTVGSAGNASAYGAFDMNGNVWEWNETAIGQDRGFRGGSCVNLEVSLRATNRIAVEPTTQNFADGFRVARSPVSPPAIIATHPSVPSGSTITGDPVDALRVIFTEPVSFTDADVTITNAAGQPVAFDASGSGSRFMIIGLATPLEGDGYTVTLAETITSVATAQPLDGDNDGVAGGDAVFTFTHRCPADTNLNGAVDGSDFFAWVAAFGQGC